MVADIAAELLSRYAEDEADSPATSADSSSDCFADSLATSLAADESDDENDEIADSLLTSAEFMNDYDRNEVLGKNITDNVTDFVRSIQSFLESELRDKDCLWSGQCADWAGSQCRHRKRLDLESAPTFSADLVTTPSSGVNFGYGLPDLVTPVSEVDELRVVTCYHPCSDHNYYLAVPRPASPVRNEDHLGIETPSDSESEIDVVSITTTPTRPQKRQKISSSSTKHISRHSPPPVAATNRKRTHKTQTTFTKPNKKSNILKTNQNTDDDSSPESPPPSPPPMKMTIKRLPQPTLRTWTKNGRYRVKGSRSAFAPGITEAEKNKRLDHNKMERQRRKISLEYCYALRDVIPFFNSQRQRPKMSKVMVLTEGAKYIRELKESEAELVKTKRMLHKRHSELVAKLAGLVGEDGGGSGSGMVRRSQSGGRKAGGKRGRRK